MGSGPARILARKPKQLYQKLGLTEEYSEAVIVLEADAYPPKKVMEYIANSCNVALENLYILLAPTGSVAGSTQISGRAIENAIHKLFDLGMDVQTIVSACGSAPISPVIQKNSDLMMGRTNDMLIYGSEVYLQVDYPNDKELQTFMQKAVSSSSEIYGKLFYEVFQEVQGDFYKIDPGIFSPAKIIVNNLQSGALFVEGAINPEMLAQSIQKSG